MNENTIESMSPEEYKALTGIRFKLNRDEARRVKANEITREQAVAERYAQGIEPKRVVPDEVWLDSELSLENYSQKTGIRFRSDPKLKSLGLSRQEIFERMIAEKREAINNA